MHTYRLLIGLLVKVEPLAVILTLSARICVERGFGLAPPGRSKGRRSTALERGLTLASAWPALLGASFGCSSEELLTLGRSPSPGVEVDAAPSRDVPQTVDAAPAFDAGTTPQLPFAFDAPVRVEELYSAKKDDNPTLTWDMLEIYFSSKRGDSTTDLWWAHRASVDEPFSEPVFLEEMSSPEFDTSPAIDGDGLTFWFGSVREEGLGALDILRVTRPTRNDAWGTPTLAVELNSEKDDIPRPTGANGRIMPLGSRRGSEIYATYFATRPNTGDAFTDVALVPDLAPAEAAAADAFLTGDGLVLLYALGLPDGPADLYMTMRPSLSEPFGEATAVVGLNTESDERDPWLSPDGNTLYFASDRDGELAIYRATRL
jgi:hypothetical protein